MPASVRAGLVHVQFETIHPYLDGNGRLGRVLIALLLEHRGFSRLRIKIFALEQPMESAWAPSGLVLPCSAPGTADEAATLASVAR